MQCCAVCRIFALLQFHILLLQGRFTIAAKHHMTIAEIYETDMVDIEKVKCFSVHELTDRRCLLSLFTFYHSDL